MLQQLSIQNYATVDTLEIEFKAGMSVISGETGAGKSIMLGGLGLTLGDRAEQGHSSHRRKQGRRLRSVRHHQHSCRPKVVERERPPRRIRLGLLPAAPRGQRRRQIEGLHQRLAGHHGVIEVAGRDAARYSQPTRTPIPPAPRHPSAPARRFLCLSKTPRCDANHLQAMAEERAADRAD